MMSDVLSEAIEDIDRYLDARPSLYEGATRERIIRLRDEMRDVLAELDAPPIEH